MSDRLSVFIEHTGLKDNEFGKKFGASKSQISDWKSGKKISMNKLGDLLEVFSELNGHWLLTGEGKMLNTAANEVNEDEQDYCNDENCLKIIKKLRAENDELKKSIIQLQQEKIKWLEKT